MFRLRVSVATFLEQARLLINGIKEDDFIRERLSGYGIGDKELKAYSQLLNKAVKAESEKGIEKGEQLEAKVNAKEAFQVAQDTFSRDRDFIKTVLKNDREKFRKIFLRGVFKDRKCDSRLKAMMETYDRILADDEVIGHASSLGITRDVLQAGKQKVLDAMEARRAHGSERGDAQHATQQRNEIFKELDQLVTRLKTVCKHAFKDRPQVLEILGIFVPSEGYDPKKTKTTK